MLREVLIVAVLAGGLFAVGAPAAGSDWSRAPRVLGGEVLLHPFDDRDRDLPFPHMSLNRGTSRFDAILMHNFPVPGWSGQGYSMEGDAMSFIDLAWMPVLPEAVDFTLYTCFRAAPTETLATLLGQQDLDSDQLLALEVNEMGLLQGRVRTEGDTLNVVIGPARVDDGAWHCAALVRDGSTLRLWMDARVQREVPLVDYHGFDLQTRLYTGCKAQGMMGVECLVGAIDEPRMYDRALGAMELTKIYAYPTESPLLAVRLAADGSAPQVSLRPDMYHPLDAPPGAMVNPGVVAWAEVGGHGLGRALLPATPAGL